jgi:hypothetical protein
MRIQAKTLPEFFALGVKGMGNILKETFCDHSKNRDVKSIIEVKTSANTCLLIDFLADVLSNSYIEKAVYCDIDIIKKRKYWSYILKNY